LMVDRVRVAAARAGRGEMQDDRPREVRRHEAEANVRGGDGLGAADGHEARSAGVWPEGVVVDAGAGEGAGFTSAGACGPGDEGVRDCGERDEAKAKRPRARHAGGNVSRTSRP